MQQCHKYPPTPLSGLKVRYNAHGPFFARLWYIAGEESGNKTSPGRSTGGWHHFFFQYLFSIACNGIVKVLGEIGGWLECYMSHCTCTPTAPLRLQFINNTPVVQSMRIYAQFEVSRSAAQVTCNLIPKASDKINCKFHYSYCEYWDTAQFS